MSDKNNSDSLGKVSGDVINKLLKSFKCPSCDFVPTGEADVKVTTEDIQNAMVNKMFLQVEIAFDASGIFLSYRLTALGTFVGIRQAMAQYGSPFGDGQNWIFVSQYLFRSKFIFNGYSNPFSLLIQK